MWLTLALVSVAGCAGGHESPSDCQPVTVTAGHVAGATPLLATSTVHLESHFSAGCECTPSVVLDSATEIVSMDACGCSDARCVDSGYEASVHPFISEGMSAGTVVQLTFAPALRTEIVDPARCIASTATVSEIVTIAPSATLRGPTLHHADAWVELRASDDRCCGTPLELVTPTLDGTTIDLAILECHPDTCDCALGTPHDASTPVDLGDLPEGTYTVRAGTVSTTLTIR